MYIYRRCSLIRLSTITMCCFYIQFSCSFIEIDMKAISFHKESYVRFNQAALLKL